MAQGAVWPEVVVFPSIVLKHHSGLGQRPELLLIKAFIAKPGIEALDVAVLPWASWIDVEGFDLIFPKPLAKLFKLPGLIDFQDPKFSLPAVKGLLADFAIPADILSGPAALVGFSQDSNLLFGRASSSFHGLMLSMTSRLTILTNQFS